MRACSTTTNWRACLITLVGLAGCIAQAAPRAGETVKANGPTWQPLFAKPLADPYVFEDEGYYYVTGTAFRLYYGKSLTRAGMRSVPLKIDFGELGGPFQVWGVKFYRHTDGVYHCYATIHFGHFITALAHLVPAPDQIWAPDKPIMSWRVDKILLGDRKGTGVLPYDQKLITDADGTLYLIYNASAGRHKNVHIFAQRMLDPATFDPTFKPRKILSPEGYRSEDRNPNYIQITEATNITRVQGKYVLLYSVGDFANHKGRCNYKLGLAYSDVLIPPQGETYTKVLQPDPRNVWGTKGKGGQEVAYLLQAEKPRWHNYCIDHVLGPGLGNIVEQHGAYSLVFHGYHPPGTKGRGGRYTWMAPLRIQIDERAPMHEWIRVLLPETREPADGD